MALKLFILCIALYLSTCEALQVVNGKIKISVLTTAGCGDTVNFITNQLTPTYNQYRDFLEIEYIPWGKTTRGANGNLVCQFGVDDCWANRVHRCALNLLKDNQDAQVNYMNCEFTNPRPAYLEGTYQCVQNVGLNLVEVDYCVTTTGSALDDASEAAASAGMSVTNFVPTIIFNDQININEHNAARTELRNMVCLALADDPSTGVINCVIG